MEVDNDIEDRNTGNKKRRHPDSSVEAPATSRTSSEILQLIEHPNFEELSRWNPVFAKAWEATKQHQKETKKTFSACVTQEFTVALTRALFKTYLDLQLPYLEDNHLCPPVPNRFFYLHWIHTQLLQGESRLGLDIGAGATAIYSLLGARFFQCNMITTEIDNRAATMAKRNIQANQLDSRIHVEVVAPTQSQDAQQPPGGPLERSLVACEQLLAMHQTPPPMLDFVMTNPPFYDPASMEHSLPRAGDGRARTTMTVSEGTYPGGEVGFVTEMFADSLRRRTSARWFSCMLGKKISFVHLEKMLAHIIGPAHIRVTEYGPGHYTRWFLAWSLEQPQATALAARSVEHCFRVHLPPRDRDPMEEIVSRLSSYCQSSPGGWAMTVDMLGMSTNGRTLQIREVAPTPTKFFVDESPDTTQATQLHIPDIVIQALRESSENHCFLPKEGHFVLSVSIDRLSTAECQVRVVGYRHSSRGEAALKKIGASLEGDICRTNRFWRRKLEREQKANSMN